MKVNAFESFKFSRNNGKNNIIFLPETMTYFYCLKYFLAESQNSAPQESGNTLDFSSTINDKPCLLPKVKNLNILAINWTFYPASYHSHGITVLEHAQCAAIIKASYSHLCSVTEMT